MNLFSIPEKAQNEERTDIFWQQPGCRVERIVSWGQTSPDGFWYDQEEPEWVCVLQGEGEITMQDGTISRLQMGDSLLIPAHCRHRVSNTSINPPCIWLCIFGQKE